MTETSVQSETQTPTPKGNRLCGFLGAFLGALLAAVLTDALIFFCPSKDLGQLTILANLILVGWASCQGYRLLRGLRSIGFAQWTVRIAVLLAQPLALSLLLTFSVLEQAHGTLPLTADVLLFTFTRSAAYLLDRSSLTAWGLLALGTLLFCRLSWSGLLKYVDPVWYAHPRRLARIGGAGAAFNMPPCWPLPPADAIPSSFSVDKGKLTVADGILTFKPWAKPRRTFPLSDVAGVVLGVSTGFNILYDKENRVLARFAWSRRNALLFGQYLLAHDIPFIDPSGAPVPTQAPTEPAPPPDRFTLRQPKLASVVGWACLLFFGAATLLSLWLVEFPVSLLCGGVFFFFVLLSLYLLLARRNQRLEVDGGQLTYTSLLGRATPFHSTDIARGVLTANRLKLLDKEGRTMVRLNLDMENISLFTQYLRARQIPLGPSKTRKD